MDVKKIKAERKEKKLLQEKLEELEYPKTLLRETLEDIANAGQDIRQAILAYARDGSIENLAEPPVDVERLMDTYGMNPIAALLFLDWYRKSPEEALQCLALGVDDIIDIPEEDDEDDA